MAVMHSWLLLLGFVVTGYLRASLLTLRQRPHPSPRLCDLGGSLRHTFEELAAEWSDHSSELQDLEDDLEEIGIEFERLCELQAPLDEFCPIFTRRSRCHDRIAVLERLLGQLEAKIRFKVKKCWKEFRRYYIAVFESLERKFEAAAARRDLRTMTVLRGSLAWVQMYRLLLEMVFSVH